MAEEVEGMELDEDAVEFAEGDAYGDVEGAWFDGPAPNPYPCPEEAEI